MKIKHNYEKFLLPIFTFLLQSNEDKQFHKGYYNIPLMGYIRGDMYIKIVGIFVMGPHE